MSWVAGIDFSTHAIDVVLIDENDVEPPQWHRYPLEGNDAFDRARDVRRALKRGPLPPFVQDLLAVGIEDPRGQNAGALYRIQGGILASLSPNVLVQPWVPSQWRKAVGLPGNCGKDMVAFFAVNDGNPDEFRDWPQDACDAYCIALATRQALTRKEAA